MKKYLIVSIITLLLVVYSNQKVNAQSGLTVTDDFESYTVGSLNGQGNWVDVVTGIEVYDNGGDKVVYSNSSTVAAIRLNQTFQPDQSAKMVFVSSSQPTRFIGPAVRCSGSGTTASFYAFVSSNSVSYLVRMINGSWEQIGTDGPAVNSGQVMEIKAEGTTISVFIDNVPVTAIATNGQTTDESLTEGSPGIAGYYPGTYTLGDDWEGAEISTNVSVTGVNLSGCPSSSLNSGASANLTAEVLPTDATNKTVTWSSSNQLVATVNTNGTVLAISEGSATITVTTEEGDFTQTCAITVEATTNEPIDVNLPGVQGVSGGVVTGVGSQDINFTGSSFSFTPDQLPVTDASMELYDGSGGTITNMIFDIEGDGSITNVRMEVDGNTIPMPDSFYDASNGLVINQFECVSVYSGN